jgi:hypothetical protein
MSAKQKHKTKPQRIKTLFVFGLLCTVFLFSFFMGNKKSEESHSSVHPYPQEVGTAIDSLLDFCDTVDSTLNVLKDSLKIESYEQRTGK